MISTAHTCLSWKAEAATRSISSCMASNTPSWTPRQLSSRMIWTGCEEAGGGGGHVAREMKVAVRHIRTHVEGEGSLRPQ